MSTSSAGVPSGLSADDARSRLGPRIRATFFSDSTRTAQTVLGLIWLLCAYLWLLQASSATNATHDMIIALVLAALSAAIAVGVGFNRNAATLLRIAIVLQLLYWLVGQGFGGIFQGGATDPNAAPLFILLAYTLMPLTRENPT
jgi:hypothetical protein